MKMIITLKNQKAAPVFLAFEAGTMEKLILLAIRFTEYYDPDNFITMLYIYSIDIDGFSFDINNL